MEWFRWIVTIAALALTAYYARDYGRNEVLAEVRLQAIEQRDAAIRQRDAEIAAGNERAGQQLVDMAALQTTIQSIERRTGSIGFQLKAALNESAMPRKLRRRWRAAKTRTRRTRRRRLPHPWMRCGSSGRRCRGRVGSEQVRKHGTGNPADPCR